MTIKASVDDPDASNNADDDNNNTIDMEALLFNRFVIDTPRGVSMLMNTSKEFLVICPYLSIFDSTCIGKYKSSFSAMR